MEMAARIAAVILIFLAVATLFAYACQRALIYYPSHASLDYLKPLAEQEGLLLPGTMQQDFIGWRGQQGHGIPVLILHGNAGHAFHRSALVSPSES
jgi:hypothetical protein